MNKYTTGILVGNFDGDFQMFVTAVGVVLRAHVNGFLVNILAQIKTTGPGYTEIRRYDQIGFQNFLRKVQHVNVDFFRSFDVMLAIRKIQFYSERQKVVYDNRRHSSERIIWYRSGSPVEYRFPFVANHL